MPALLVIGILAAIGRPACANDGPAGPPALGELLTRTGKSVELFWKHFPAVTCTELVRQAKLGNAGKVLYERNSAFDYLIFLDLEGTDLSVEESRVAQNQTEKGKDLPLLVTSGFSTMVLVFHPFYQGSFEYRVLGEERVDGKNLLKVGYQHIRGTRSTSALRMRGRDYPLDLQGVAWIDTSTDEIVRMTAGLMAPMDDLNLKSLNTEVRYSPVRFDPIREEYWLPMEATIELATARQNWRNVHKFTGYRHFSVNAESTVKR